jgi:hypothetical protein
VLDGLRFAPPSGKSAFICACFLQPDEVIMATFSARVLLTTATVSVLAGCGVKTRTVDVSPRMNRPASCEAVIRVFDSRAEIPADYYELAFIEAEGNSVYTTDKKLQDQIIKRAAQVGATAIVANPVSEAKTGVKILGEALGTKSATSKASALAIYMPADDGRLVQLCGVSR